MRRVLFSLMGCLMTLQCFANGLVNEKFYVSPGSVYVAPDAIYVNINGNFFSVEGIAVDENGVYIQDAECRMMYCLKCGQFHDSGERCPR